MERSKLVLWELIDNIGVLSIDSDAQNKITDPEFVELSTLQSWVSENEINGLIITSNKRNFSLGASIETIKEAAKDDSLIIDKLNKGKEILDYLSGLFIPVVSAVKGVCFGAGLEIALSSHFRVCAENSIFGFPESNLNLLPGLGGTVRLPELVGAKKAIEIILSGDTVDAADALRIGLVDYIVPKKEVLAFSVEFLNKMTSGKSLHVIHSVMKAINNSRYSSFENAMTEETRLFAELAKKEFS